MSTFDNVTIIKKANIYFGGKVTSRTVVFADGSRKTLGVMLPGEYEFSTDAAELMEITSGDLTVLIAGQEGWQAVQGGQSFSVPAKSKFNLRVSEITDYCCSFLG